MIYIRRNSIDFGPYDRHHIKKLVEEARILKQDVAYLASNPSELKPVRYFLKKYKIKTKIQNNGSIISQIKNIGKEVILPIDKFNRKKIFYDNRFLILTLVGLSPVILMKFTFFSNFTFYSIALYFSMVWGLFYFYLFKTKQVNLKITILIFFLTQAFILLLILLQSLPGISHIYSLTESDLIIERLMGYIFGVGFFEELIKLLPIYFIAKYSKEPLIPQTLVFYGLISGTGFGASEGVLYQIGLNSKLDYNSSFFMNIARLTSLPFLHSVWTGISAYFISFANLYPKFRISLYFLGLGIPSILHGTYNVFGWSIIGLIITFVGVILLTFYLGKGPILQSRLK
jgi:RsiW-degrading membrane proteinase PrsW (M82 family)